MDTNRKTAYLTLFEMENKQAYSNLELNRQIKRENPDTPAFVRELVYGVAENRIYLDYLLDQLIPKGISKVKKQAKVLLRMGLYQLIFMDSVPDYAAISETVKLARKMAPGLEGFVNGVLRGYTRKKAQLKLPDREKDPVAWLSVNYSCAEWIVRLWIEQYGVERAEQLLAAGNRKPPLSIRVNLLKTSVDALAAELTRQGFDVEPGKLSKRALHVRGSGLLETESYQKGLFSVQDEASMVAMEILAPKRGERVLDICAAPGGKTLAMAEMMENCGQVDAFDLYAHKLDLILREAHRLGITCVEAHQHDGCIPDPALAEKADRVLVDAPCSGLGVISRKPEIKYREIEDQCRSLAQKQLEILTVSSGYVRKGGILLYSTCTVNNIENTDVVEHFLQHHREFSLMESRQLFTGEEGTDGFFICKMCRKEA